MSADWWLEGAPKPAEDAIPMRRAYEDNGTEWNLTYNLTPMLQATGLWPDESYRALVGKRAGDLGELILGVVTCLRQDPAKYEALNPPNGWGDYSGCLAVMESFLSAIERYPGATVGAWL